MNIQQIKDYMRDDIAYLRKTKFSEKKIAARINFYQAIVEKLEETTLQQLYDDYVLEGESYGMAVGDCILYPVWIKNKAPKKFDKLKRQT